MCLIVPALAASGSAEGGAGFHWLDVPLLRNQNTRWVVLSTALLGVASGIIGSFLLLRKRSLMGDALSHATLPGIGIAFGLMVAMGGEGKWLPGLLLGATISGVIGLLVMLAIQRTTRLRDDVSMGLVLSVFFGLGVAVLGVVQRLPNAAGLEDFIYGKPASIVEADFVMTQWLAAVVAVLAVVLFKEFKLLCFDDGFAASQGWPVLALDILLLGMVTAVTVIGLQSVGLILIIAFLITPPAAARFWTNDLLVMMVLSGVIGGISGWLGSAVSALAPRLPAGAVIVVVAAVIFLLSMFLAPRRGVLGRWLRHRRLRRKIGRQHVLRGAYEILEAGHAVPDNRPFSRRELAEKRTWTSRGLERILRRERRTGHLEMLPGSRLRLTEEGFGEAARITRNHRLWEMYLVTHADIAPSHVDRDADMVEHVLEADLVQRLETALRADGVWVPQPRSPHRI
ncbi:iron chelate uptake ABC transporter family permease subunit [Haloferula sp. A504]|uniref:metal ABC transporter permease n=1 Tax=Haloferula sp. A504 TaxID=3373601 RepID=UPI0031C5DBCE|nr:metal ABC transporter permease [Verrucomicrobiaceae bacterium E54]